MLVSEIHIFLTSEFLHKKKTYNFLRYTPEFLCKSCKKHIIIEVRQFKPDRLLKNIYDFAKKFTDFRTRKKPDKIGLFRRNIFFVFLICLRCPK